MRLRWKSVVALVGIVRRRSSRSSGCYGLKDYQRQRITSFLNPEADLRGAGWHAHHARVAIGNGGLLRAGVHAGARRTSSTSSPTSTPISLSRSSPRTGAFSAGCVLLGLYGFLERLGDPRRVAGEGSLRRGARGRRRRDDLLARVHQPRHGARAAAGRRRDAAALLVGGLVRVDRC